MTQQFAHRLMFVISLVCQFSICLGTEAPDVNQIVVDANGLNKSLPKAATDSNAVEVKPVIVQEDQADRYLAAVREFADNVLLYGRDTYGPKHTPLFVDGLNVNTHEPVKWINPDGYKWVLSNLASQQNLFRTLDGLTRITGDPKYKQAAMDAIKYAFENLRSPTGLFYWGRVSAYDAQADKVYDGREHSFKFIYPYYELMWEVDSKITEDFVEAFWATNVIDWSNLEMNRYGSLYTLRVLKGWDHEYKGGPVFFESQGLSGIAAGSDLFYAGSVLSKLSGKKQPLVWSKRLAHRYVETRNPNIGISGWMYTRGGTPTLYPFNNDFSDHGVMLGRIFPMLPGVGNPGVRQQLLDDLIVSPGVFNYTFINPCICQLLLGEMLGSDGKEFKQWAYEELTAWGKVAYRPRDNSFIPMIIDGTSLEGYVCNEDSSFGPAGTVFMPIPAESSDFWAYALAYRMTGDSFMWEITRSIAQGNKLGDIGVDIESKTYLQTNTDCSVPYALLGFLELYKKTNKKAFLDMAQRIGDNILTNHFYRGFFVPSHRHIYAKFDAIEALVLLHLDAALNMKPSQVPWVWLSRPSFKAPYRMRNEEIDSAVFYRLTDTLELPNSLQEVIATGKINEIKLLISKGVDIDGWDFSLIRPLYCATKSGYKEIVELLLAEGANVNAKSGFRFDTSLHYAVELGNKEIAKLFVANGAEINVTNCYGDTPLQYAAYNDRKDIIELLLQKGATIVNLHIASYMGNLEKAEAFIKEGVDMNALDSHGYAPLHYAARNNQKEAVELLVAKGADINVKNWPGQTPLDIALSNNQKGIVELLLSKGAALSIHTAARMGDIERVKSMIEGGTDVNAKDNNGWTALLHAVTGGHKELVELLLAKGADVNVKDSRNRTPFYYAIIAARTDMAKLLIAKGFDISAKDSFGYTPLHWALIMRNQELAEFILAQGVDINIRDKDGWTPLHQAAYNGAKELSEMFINKGADVNVKSNIGETPLDTAVFTNANPVVDLLIAKGAESSTLNVAAYRGDLDKIKAALKDGADVNSKNSEGETLLYSAALEGRKDIVEFLIIQGADVNSKNSQAKTALHAAAVGGHKDVVELLIAKGVDINVLSSMNQTPLYLAVSNKHKEVVELLLEKGANLDIKDRQGRTSLQIAEKMGNTEIVELLRKHQASKVEGAGSTTNTPQGMPASQDKDSQDDKDAKSVPTDPNEK